MKIRHGVQQRLSLLRFNYYCIVHSTVNTVPIFCVNAKRSKKVMRPHRFLTPPCADATAAQPTASSGIHHPSKTTLQRFLPRHTRFPRILFRRLPHLINKHKRPSILRLRQLILFHPTQSSP